MDTAFLDAAESLLLEAGEDTTLQTHEADYAEIVWQRRLRNEVGEKEETEEGNMSIDAHPFHLYVCTPEPEAESRESHRKHLQFK